LRHYATNRKVVGSRPNEVNEYSYICLILPTALGPGVHTACNRNEYQKQKKKSVSVASVVVATYVLFIMADFFKVLFNSSAILS
jgi:hypothetical protein